MNWIGVAAAVAAVFAFGWSFRYLGRRPMESRRMLLGVFAVLSVPSMLFAAHYLHVVPEMAWLYTFRSWTGTEFVSVFPGLLGGVVASFLPRFLLGVVLFGVLGSVSVPYIKPLLVPLPDSVFQENWQGGICLQSTPSTCGPASVSTILKRLGGHPSELAAARAAHTYAGGTEAWYLARYVRAQGFIPRFTFRDAFSPSVGLPAMVGVKLGGAGHFIAVLSADKDRITIADPLRGEETISRAEFDRRYVSTGFHMTVHAKP